MEKSLKELLLQDLCARLPYGVICKVHYSFNNETTFGEDVEAEADCPIVRIDVQAQTVYVDLVYEWFCIDEIKPYLRPMSSMTITEKLDFNEIQRYNVFYSTKGHYTETDWLNAHHFDFRNLIERGLAIDCTGLNIY